MKLEKQKNTEFSKKLLIQESVLIWIITLVYLTLAFFCIYNQYFGEFSWLTAMSAFPWTAYGVSQACYYRKSEKENTIGGIKYDSVMAQIRNNYSNQEPNNYFNQEPEDNSEEFQG